MSSEYRSCIKINENFNYENSDIFSIGFVILGME